MSTRSTIAMKDGDKFRSIYCNFDGYPDHHYPILNENYNTDEKVRELMDLGDLCSLDKDLISCEFYHRDMNEKYEDTKCMAFSSYNELIKHAKTSGNYFYFWDKGEWHYY